MARIRTIKPAFFRHRRLFLAERDTGLPLRVAFAGLWTVADREGRFRWEPDEIKLDCLPYDDVDFSQVLAALAEGEFIIRYRDDEREYGYIPSWHEHQVVNQRETRSTFPEPRAEMHVHAHASTCAAHIPNGVNIPSPLRETVYARDGFKCLRCSATDNLSIDHIFPQSMGGTHAITNLRTLCRSCNSARSVVGQALIDDLAKDGLTLDDMQRICMHVRAQDGTGREGKGREQEGNATRRNASMPSADFLSFWNAYPKRKGSNPRHPAWLSFAAAMRGGTDPIRIVTGTKHYSAECDDLKITNTDKVAQAVTWLNQRRWEDYQPADQSPEAAAERERFMAEKGYRWNGEQWVNEKQDAA